MELSRSILSDIIVHTKYARHRPELGRKETWPEIVTRNMNMHTRRFPELAAEIAPLYSRVLNKEVLPSMRSMQFAGAAIEVGPQRIYNCAYLPIEDIDGVAESMFLLLSGVGVGYSVQKQHVEKLPPLQGPNPTQRRRRFLIGDSIEGWADALKVLLKSYFHGGRIIDFDYRAIRPKGRPLKTSGGKAPGPEPLRNALSKITGLLESAVAERGPGTRIKPIEVHDIMCHAADAVISGGIRRSAMIALFSMEDEELLAAKSGNWWELNPQRARANNSAVAVRGEVDRETFDRFWQYVVNSGSGEPGIYWTNNPEWGTNPCVEIALKPYQFCNLTEINAHDIHDQETLNERARVAAAIGTIQASYTDFHYLREEWQRTVEEDSLIGVSMTGIASGSVEGLNLEQAAQVVKETNREWSAKLGISPAARTTCVKPAGTTSLVLGTSSGIHAWHAPYYIRRIRFGKDEPIAQYLQEALPDLVEPDQMVPGNVVLSVPQAAPEGAVFKDTEDALGLLDRAAHVSRHWVRMGHQRGENTHNVSITVNVKDDEWQPVGEWMWEHQDEYNGIAVLPHFGGSYPQLPFEETTREEYERLYALLGDIDLTKVVEEEGSDGHTEDPACAGGACEVDVA